MKIENLRLAMKQTTTRDCQKWSTVVGSYLLLFPIGFFWYWGNMATYVLSYFLISVHTSTGIETPWVLSFGMTARSFGFMASEAIEHFFGRRALVVVGIICCNMAFFGSYFTISTSMILLDLTLGGLSGFSLGLMVGAASNYIVEWSDGDTGTLTSIILSAMVAGAAAYNPFMTFYINPDNLPPDYTYKDTKYFSDEGVLDRVPPTFLILGVVSLAIQVVGFLMLRTPPTVARPKTVEGGALEMDASTSENHSILTSNGQTNNHVPVEETESLDALGMLRNKVFYALWFSYVLLSMSLKIFLDYFKLFGQIWIKNDHYMNAVVTTVSIAAIVARIIWGFLLDRIHIKHIVMGLSATTSVLTMLFYFSPGINKWFYFLVTVVLASITSVLKPTMVVVVVKAFGRNQLKLKIGLMSTAQIAAFNCLPPILSLLLSNFGWFAIYAWSSAVTLLSLISIIFFVPNVTNYYRLHA